VFARIIRARAARGCITMMMRSIIML
jgi:hypothetical protein